MTTLTDRILVVQEQVSQLIGEYERLYNRVMEQDNEAREKQRSMDVLKARVAELERENEVLRKAERTAVESGPDEPGSKERIDELVAEIDRCLELLNP